MESKQTVIEARMNGDRLSYVRVFWAEDSWQVVAYAPAGFMKGETLDFACDANIDDVIDQALWQLNISGLKHEDFAKFQKDCAIWMLVN
jgi:hypothetical protein